MTSNDQRPQHQPNSVSRANRWLTAQGPIDGNHAVLDVHNTRGGVLDSSAPPPTRVNVGQMILQFDACDVGTVSYAIDSVDQVGIIPIQRITPDNFALCGALSATTGGD